MLPTPVTSMNTTNCVREAMKMYGNQLATVHSLTQELNATYFHYLSGVLSKFMFVFRAAGRWRTLVRVI